MHVISLSSLSTDEHPSLEPDEGEFDIVYNKKLDLILITHILSFVRSFFLYSFNVMTYLSNKVSVSQGNLQVLIRK